MFKRSLDSAPITPDKVIRLPSVFTLMFSKRISATALKVSLVVGTVLNLVNNGDHLWTDYEVDVWRVFLNFVVPFCVSSYSAARSEVQRAAGAERCSQCQ